MTTRAELLAMEPARYLAQGFRDEQGRARPELTTLWAAAAVEQLRAHGVTARAFEPLVADAAKQALASDAPLKIEALPSAGALHVAACAHAVRQPEDRQPFAQHLAATLRLLSLAEATAPFNAAQAPRGQ